MSKILFLSCLSLIFLGSIHLILSRVTGELESWSWRNSQVDGLILTLTCYSNYGNIMQRYALKHILKQNGKIFDSTFIQIMQSVETGVIFKKTREFVQKYIGGEDFDVNKLQGYRNYVVGSDQVWCKVFPRYWSWAKLAPYFCEFVDNNLNLNFKANRISYAASFGLNKVNVTMDVEEQERARPLLKKFSAISVREFSGRDILKNTWGLESTVVLDPTLLLKQSDYSELIENSSSRNAKVGNVFYYIISSEKRMMDFIGNFSRALGGTKTGIVIPKKKRFESVEKWLKGFRDANFVITNSYHGVIFSIVNNKDFIAIDRIVDARFDSLLGILGLTNRLIKINLLEDVTPSNLSSIDWTTVNKKLEVLRGSSLKWLLENLK